MKVLVNATTLVKGGGIQVAASFIAESCRDDMGIAWHYAISPQVAEELASLGADPSAVTLFTASPTRDKVQRQQLYALEKRLQPDVVFSVFGPAYMKFRSPHLCGVAVGWVTHSTRLAFAALPNWLARAKTFLTCVYKGFWLRYADRWVVEAESARDGMHRRIGVSPDNVDIVENSCAAVFNAADLAPSRSPDSGEVLRLVYVSAYYPHKNIEFIPAVAEALRRKAPDQGLEFIVTLPDDEPGLQRLLADAAARGVSDCIRNAGRVSLRQIIELYRDAHLCYMPSLLETFSATYPEAMALGRPIVTNDLDFAHANCGNAAVFAAPNDADAHADAILGLLRSSSDWGACIERGRARLAELPDARRKYELYVQAIRATAAEM